MKALGVREALEEAARKLRLGAAKAASIAEVPLDELLKRTRDQLLEAARALDLRSVSKMKKEDLAKHLLQAVRAMCAPEQQPPASRSSPAAKAADKPQPPAARAAEKAPAPAKEPEKMNPPTKAAQKAPPPSQPDPATPARPPEKAQAPAAKPTEKAQAPAATPVAKQAAPAKISEEKPAKAPPAPEPSAVAEEESDPTATAKLDLGPGARHEKPPKDIPWSYGIDRVTAAAVDPDRLYVYWEVTDTSIESARAALAQGGPGAWLNLRVYDTTDRLFDGTNAHGYFDHRLERSDRQWFFTIGKPTSTAVVEVGMKSHEGYFARIARSGRVDFPRREPAPWREPEWMTVLASGETRGAGRGAPSGRPGPAPRPEPQPQPAPGGIAPGGFTPIPLWITRDSNEAREIHRQLLESGWERVEWKSESGESWFELIGRTEWFEPALVTSWEAGPFTYPVEVGPPSGEAWEGPTLVYKVGGVTHVVTGPWQVVIRNLGAHSGRAVLGRWQIYRWWVAEAGREVRTAAAQFAAPGASEQVSAAGASERRWIAGSELRLGGASELWRLGASELRFRGASERLYAGASEWSARGASERWYAGASELRLGGASERAYGGASERAYGGASERAYGGASERAYGGASEQRLGGASELAKSGGAPGAPSSYPEPDDVSPAATE